MSKEALKEGWVDTTLGEITEGVIRGIAPSYSEEGDYVINQKCIRGGTVSYDDARKNNTSLKAISQEKYLKIGDILICSTGQGTLGRVGQIKILNGKTTIDSHVSLIRSNHLSDSKYLGFLLRGSQEIFEGMAEGSTGQTDLPRAKLTAFQIFLPPLPEQKAIAAVLSSLDDKIDLLREQNKILETLAQTLFNEWFVEFNFPNEQGLPYKTSGGKMIETEEVVIPEGWRVGEIGDFANLKSGYAFKSEDFVSDSLIKAIKIKDLKGSGIVDLENLSSIDENCAQLLQVKKFKLKANDILLAMSGNTTGKIGLMVASQKAIYLNQRVGKFFFKIPNYQNFLYLFLLNGNFESQILNMGYGSAQPNINPNQIDSIEIILPVEKILYTFNDITRPMMDKILINIQQTQTLSTLRDELLPKLMSGDIRVNAN